MTQDWKYGDYWERAPIEDGEVWRDQHGNYFAVGDLCVTPVERILAMAGRPKLVYMDPPWNQSNISSFYTKAGVDQDGRRFPFTDFLARVMRVVRELAVPAYVETGLGSRVMFLECAHAAGLRETHEWQITYYRKNPCLLFRLVRQEDVALRGTIPNPSAFDGVDDDHTPGIAMQQETEPGDLVADFCFGRGLTARTALQHRRRFVGLELNKRRAAWPITHFMDRGSRFDRTSIVANREV